MATITVIDDERSGSGWAFAFFLLLILFFMYVVSGEPGPDGSQKVGETIPRLDPCRFQQDASDHHGNPVKVGPVQAAGNCKPGDKTGWMQHPNIPECYMLTYATMPIPAPDSVFAVIGTPTLKFIDGKHEWVLTNARFVKL